MSQQSSILDTASMRIARFATDFDPSDLPQAAYRSVGRAVVDTVGIALAAADDGACAIALNLARAEGAAAAARIWTHADSASLTSAAFYNGVAAHVLDFDDVNSPLRGHPSVVMLPALLALAQHRDIAGRRLASAYAVGLEVMVKIARAMVSDHYAKGWHATTTIGVLGAATACSHLLGLSAGQTANAIGLAFAQSSGSRANFGTMAKPFQAGHCNASALRAALLAEAGMDAAPDALDGPQGFTTLYGNRESLDAELASLGQAPLELLASGLEIKKYPMCYAAHRSIDGLLDLRREHGLQAEQVAAIHVESNRRAMVPLIHPRPQTGLEAKFSMPYAMAAAALDGHVRLASFTDQAVQRPAVRALMQRVTTEEADGPVTPRWNIVTVTLHDGTKLRKEIRTLRGSHDCPLSDDELADKWDDCLAFGGYRDRGRQFFDAALDIASASIPELLKRMPQRAVASSG